MSRLSNFIQKQGTLLLTNRRYALLSAVLLSIAPHTMWLSLAIVALVILRKGIQIGTMFLMPVAISYLSMSLMAYTVNGAVINTLLTFLPCYVAACALYLTTSWRAVAAALFLQVLFMVLLVQFVFPEFIQAQYMYLQALIRESRPDNALLSLLQDASILKQTLFANYLFGIQVVMVVLSTLLPLLLARSVQSQLFYPGAFRQEILSFRGNKVGLLLWVAVFVAAMQQNTIAINILPLFLVYSVLAGLSLCANTLANKKTKGVFFIVLTPLVLLPFVAGPLYIVVAALDSVFNFRLYTPRK